MSKVPQNVLDRISDAVKSIVVDLGGNPVIGFRLSFMSREGPTCFHSIGRTAPVLHSEDVQKPAESALDSAISDFVMKYSTASSNNGEEPEKKMEPCSTCRHHMREFDACFMGRKERPCDQWEECE